LESKLFISKIKYVRASLNLKETNLVVLLDDIVLPDPFQRDWAFRIIGQDNDSLTSFVGHINMFLFWDLERRPGMTFPMTDVNDVEPEDENEYQLISERSNITEEESNNDRVFFSITGPHTMEPNNFYILDVWAHRDQDKMRLFKGLRKSRVLRIYTHNGKVQLQSSVVRQYR
jgi:hypothetical protein